MEVGSADACDLETVKASNVQNPRPYRKVYVHPTTEEKLEQEEIRKALSEFLVDHNIELEEDKEAFARIIQIIVRIVHGTRQKLVPKEYAIHVISCFFKDDHELATKLVECLCPNVQGQP